MRALLVLLPVVLAGCGPYVTQREILMKSQAEIDRREPWASTAAIIITTPGDDSHLAWKVKAGAVDYSAYHPHYKRTYFVSGTERELCYSLDGCLLGYHYVGSRCPVEERPAGMTAAPGK